MNYDLIVVGGGAAGIGAARTAVQHKAHVMLISNGEPGGDCTFTGCVPSKTLIESARRGLRYSTAATRVQDVVAQIAATESAHVLRDEGAEVLTGYGRFTGERRIEINGKTYTAPRIVLASGSRPYVPALPGLDRIPYLTNETIFGLTELPNSMVVLGGGAIGCELAQALSRFGTQVTIVEAGDRLLPREEPETSRLIEEVFVREGITVDTGERVSRVSPMPVDGVKLTLTSGKSVQAQRLLVAVGRRADTENLNLDAAGIEIDERGTVVTTSTLATTAKGVWAAGDVTGRLPFTHAAFAMGRLAASNALGHRLLQRNYHPEATPWVTFTDPEVARVGLTEAAVAAKGGGRVAYLPMAELDRAITADATDGFIKLLAGPRQFLRNVGGGKVLGATIVAERAGELIGEPALAMATGMFTGRLAQAIHAYPTWSSGLQLAAAQFFFPVGGRAAKPARQA